MGDTTTKYYGFFFAPDLDNWWEVNPGLLIDISNLVPNKRGTYVSYQSGSSKNLGNGTFSEATYGIALGGEIIKRLDGTARMFAGTTKRLMENTGSAWVDVSLGGSDYSVAANWNFTSFGNDVIAVSKTNPPQVSSSGTFANLGGGPPKASVCTTQRNFVILGDTNDGVDDLGDRVWWSALGNDASWTASAATQAGNLRLRDTPGRITALVNMRDAVAVYKEDSVYLLDYQGSPLLWTARLISDKVGCASQDGVAVINGIHYFVHRTGLHRFDGASVKNIGTPVNRYLFDRMGSQVNYKTVQATSDEYQGIALFFFHDSYTTDGGGAGTNERRYALVYNAEANLYGFVKDAWDTGSGTCRCVMKATLSDITAWNVGQAAEVSNVLTLGVVDGDVTTRRPLFRATLASGLQAYIQTGNLGDHVTWNTLKEFTIRCDALNPMSDATVSYNTKVGEVGSATFVGNNATKYWNGMVSAHFFRIGVPMEGVAEVVGMYATITKAGTKP